MKVESIGVNKIGDDWRVVASAEVDGKPVMYRHGRGFPGRRDAEILASRIKAGGSEINEQLWELVVELSEAWSGFEIVGFVPKE